ncbi:hypothetical protein Hypma_014276 [Hypsizygus marmoreus]|uniref:Uncharacterized protein n=1 Tax=Hypsizygus marmoreus TaxID=39966 RepID=A0A369JAI2_HYPMA|nr:hypothetical protein Hypma_014276 [Hypsizygus marmoreus]
MEYHLVSSRALTIGYMLEEKISVGYHIFGGGATWGARNHPRCLSQSEEHGLTKCRSLWHLWTGTKSA